MIDDIFNFFMPGKNKNKVKLDKDDIERLKQIETDAYIKEAEIKMRERGKKRAEEEIQ